MSNETINSCVVNLNFKFIRLNLQVVKLVGNQFKIDKDLAMVISNSVFKKFLRDAANYSIQSFNKSFDRYKFVDGFVRYNKYGRKDVCRVLNWNLDVSSTVYGYRTSNGVTPCFVTYHKSDEVSESTSYNDHFINQVTFAWESRSRRRIESEEIQNVINSKRILLFVKKEDGEGTDFYYLGDCKIVNGSIREDKMPGTNISVVHFSFELDKPVENDLYEYIIK